MIIIEFDSTDLRLQAKNILTAKNIRFEDGKTYRHLIIHTNNKQDIIQLFKASKLKKYTITESNT